MAAAGKRLHLELTAQAVRAGRLRLERSLTGRTASGSREGNPGTSTIALSTSLALLVSSRPGALPGERGSRHKQQIAATVLGALGYDPRELQAVQKEDDPLLPFLFDPH